MIPVAAFNQRTVAVLGLARSGLSTARALRAGGADVVAWDDAAARREAARAAGITLADPAGLDWREIAALVPSPGVPLHAPTPHAAVLAARAAGCEVIGDMELFARAKLPARIAAVTGTNGKSTTTALLAYVLRACGRAAVEGGNIGTAVLDLPVLGDGGVYVLELSSYQLDLTKSFTADIAVMLNLSADHIDRHGSMAAYVAAKERLFLQQRPEQIAAIGVDDADSRAMFERVRTARPKSTVPFSANSPLAGGVFVQDGVLHDARLGPARPVIDLRRGRLIGGHNWQNAAAAYAAATALDCPPEAAARALLTFPGLAHRIEDVGVVQGVRFINDSKATNADAAARALACFDNVYWIAGGRPKEGGIGSLASYFPRIRHAFLIGEAAADFAATLADTVPHTRSQTLARATEAALTAARKDGIQNAVVLLSPACASFDQFKNFEERGDVFRDLVGSLGGGKQKVAR